MQNPFALSNFELSHSEDIWKSTKRFVYLGMTLKIELLHPKAKKLLQDLADLDLILIKEDTKDPFFGTVKKIRAKRAKLTEEEIASEVRKVRSAKHVR